MQFQLDRTQDRLVRVPRLMGRLQKLDRAGCAYSIPLEICNLLKEPPRPFLPPLWGFSSAWHPLGIAYSIRTGSGRSRSSVEMKQKGHIRKILSFRKGKHPIVSFGAQARNACTHRVVSR